MSNLNLITREILQGRQVVEDCEEVYKHADMIKIQSAVYISGSGFLSIHAMSPFEAGSNLRARTSESDGVHAKNVMTYTSYNHRLKSCTSTSMAF